MRRALLVASFLPAFFFPFAVLLIGMRNPSVIDGAIISKSLPAFSTVFIILVFQVIYNLLNKTTWPHDNLPGLFLSVMFGIGYFFLASFLNRPDFNSNNILFGSDNWSWYQRMGSPEGWYTGVRAVHPLAHIIFRPMVALMSVFTYGDRFSANLVLLTFAGIGCVFLMWKIVYELTINEVNAFLFASLLGVSASHLIFASVIETYIFSALFLLLFIWLLISNKPAYMLIITGVLTLGTTLTNIAQQVLILVFRIKIKRAIILFCMMVLMGIGLNLISRLIYPVTEYFFLPQNFVIEQRFTKDINLKRFILTTENIFVYNVAAPQPYLGLRNGIPHFNLLTGSIGDYIWFGWPGFLLWMVTLSLTIYCFIRNIRLDRNEYKLSIALLSCLVFNFLLHVGYGSEPFLYSANWTYALVLFSALSLKNFSDQTWFKMGLLVTVASVLINNLWLLYFVTRHMSQLLE